MGSCCEISTRSDFFGMQNTPPNKLYGVSKRDVVERRTADVHTYRSQLISKFWHGTVGDERLLFINKTFRVNKSSNNFLNVV